MKLGIIKLKSNIMLVLTALIWGVTFVAQKSAMDYLEPNTFNSLRSLIGAFALFLVSLIFKEKRNKNKKKNRRLLTEGGLVAGAILFMGITLQQIGIVNSTAGKAGFISSLYVVFVPLFALISGKKIEKHVWFGIFIALLGLFFLCYTKDQGAFMTGDLIILFSALFFALHIFCISKYAKKIDAIKLSAVQFLFAGLLSGMMALIFESTSLIAVKNSYRELFCAGVLSCAIAFTFQISAQKYVKSYIASLILSFESVFAVIAGYFILNEVLSLKEILGCVLMFVGLYVAKIKTKEQKLPENSLQNDQ